MDLERFLQLIDDFIDNELDDFGLIEEFEEELENEFCCCFFNTFRKTTDLCHQIHQLEIKQVPQKLHYRIIQTIENCDKKPAKRKKTTRKKRN
ncbi:MAG: hypothetical protein V1833_01085 [Elusimicrobiota bacterium]